MQDGAHSIVHAAPWQHATSPADVHALQGEQVVPLPRYEPSSLVQMSCPALRMHPVPLDVEMQHAPTHAPEPQGVPAPLKTLFGPVHSGAVVSVQEDTPFKQQAPTSAAQGSGEQASTPRVNAPVQEPTHSMLQAVERQQAPNPGRAHGEHGEHVLPLP